MIHNINICFDKIWFCLGSLFNGISTFAGYLMPKPSLQKDSSNTIQSIAGGGEGVHIFPNVSPKINIIE